MCYTAAAEYLAKSALYCFITMALVRGVMEQKKGKSFFILFGIRAAYEIVRLLIRVFGPESEGGMGIYDEGTALLVSLFFSCAVLAASIYAWKKVMTDYPAGSEPKNNQRSGKQKAAQDEQRKKSLAWQEMRSMNRPANSGKKSEVVATVEETADSAVSEDFEVGTAEDESTNAEVKTAPEAEQDDNSDVD